ncbi:MAG: sugar transferase [Anaerotignum sp.]|nr:sugar transferase [Anaerotignum sp.]
MTDLRRKNKFKIVLDIFINVLGMALLFAAIWVLFYRYNLQAGFLYKKGTFALIVFYSVLYFLFASLYGGHNLEYYRTTEIIYSQCLSMVMVNAITWVQICLIDRRFVAVLPIIILTVLDIVFIVFWAVTAIRRFRSRNIPREMTLLYSGEPPYELEAKLKHYQYKFKVRKHVEVSGGFEDVIAQMDSEDGVMMGDIDPVLKDRLIRYCFERKIPICIVPNAAEIVLRSSYTISLLDTPVLVCRRGELSLLEEFIKRSFDIVVASCALVVLSPVMLAVAIGIKLYDRGPVFYKQKRLTIHGATFELIKFRSMIVDAEKDGVARLAKANDSRITPLGAILRRYRLDELPQLINIIKGEMSIVGPRAERPEIAAQYEKDIPEFAYRLKVKAGLTGYAQVLGRYNTTPYDKLMWDLMYIESYSVLMDLKIIMMTIKILFMPESTAGVGENDVTAQKNR